jgi:hypothetical protein
MEQAMNVIAESSLRILIPRRNMHDLSRFATRHLIHGWIAHLRASHSRQVNSTRV